MCFGGVCGDVLVGLNDLKGVVIKHLQMAYSCGGESNGCGSVGGVGVPVVSQWNIYPNRSSFVGG